MGKYKSEFLNIMEERGFIYQCTDFDGLDDLLNKEIVTGYIGFDATADSLHVGSLIQIMRLRWFQKTGHKPIVLMGGGTTKIGDPSERDESRPMLTDDFIRNNITGIEKAFKKLLTFGDRPTDAITVNNDEWLSKLNYADFLRDYGTCFTVNKMISMESVKLRLEREHPMTFLEFNYMIMQGYDFLELYRRYGCRLQMSGSDQWGNVIQGVELGRRKEHVDLYGLTCALLTTASGKKMGKTEDGAVWLNEDKLSPYDYYQYWRNADDADVGKFLRLFTELDIAEIKKLESLEGSEVNEAKKVLAFEATKILHGEAAAKQAAETARKTFEEGAIAEGLPTLNISRDTLAAGISIISLLKESGLAESNGAAKRLIKGGGARVNDVVVEDENQTLALDALNDDGTIKLSAGKKKHAVVRVA